jgi:IclR family transcriptional regulator, KDG regulon repressor
MGKTAFSNSERLLSGVAHALDVLELLARERKSLGLSQIARELGMSKAGIHRVLATLGARGYVERHPGGQYGLSIKVWELGCSLPDLEIVKTAAPIMERVARETGDSGFLVALSGFSAVNLHSVAADQAVRVHVDLGSRLPANCTGAGLALLATLNDEELERILPIQLPASTPITITDHDELRRELSQIRSRGYAINLGGWRIDVGGVAVAIPGPSGRAVAALNVAGPRYRLTRPRLKAMTRIVQEAAAEIAVRLRSGPGSTYVSEGPKPAKTSIRRRA